MVTMGETRMSVPSPKKTKQRSRELAKVNALTQPKELPLTANRGTSGFSFFVETITLT